MTAANGSSTVEKVVSLFEATPGARSRALSSAARDIAERAFASAGSCDEDGAYPAAEVAALHESRLLAATLPRELGGSGIGGSVLCVILRRLGSGSLPLGRLFEGHVNAIGLALGYGSRADIVERELQARRAGVQREYGSPGAHVAMRRE
jgi:alkylation response protein AidB-like acyl-CoA dehydrogenase